MSRVYNNIMDRKVRQLHEEADTILQIGQDSDKKAIPLVREVMQEREKKAEESNFVVLERLAQAKHGTIRTYNRLLANLLIAKLHTVDWPPNWYFTVIPDDTGVILMMKYKDHLFRSAFKPTGEEKYDLNAVLVYTTRAENTIDRIMGYDKPITKAPAGENL